MTKALFAAVKKNAEKTGSSDAAWLKSETAPVFQTVESLDSKGGPELVLLHGLLGALSNWDESFPRFEEFCRPIALQFPILTGHRSEVKVKALASYTEYFIRSRNLAPVALCGNSLGGHVAMRMYLAAPELVDCMILTGTSGLYEHSVDALPVRPDRKYIRENMARVFFDKKYISDEAVEDVFGILAKRMNVLNLIHAARSAKKDNLRDLLKTIRCPVLLVWGEDDQITTMEVAEIFQKELPNAKLVTLKNCGHAPMIEHPAAFASAVRTFLKEHSRVKETVG